MDIFHCLPFNYTEEAVNCFYFSCFNCVFIARTPQLLTLPRTQAFTAVSVGSFSGPMFGCDRKTRSLFINGTDNITHTHANGRRRAISTFFLLASWICRHALESISKSTCWNLLLQEGLHFIRTVISLRYQVPDPGRNRSLVHYNITSFVQIT